MEEFLTSRRNRINREFDYRYSVLPMVFANLLRSGKLNESQLHGLAEDKLELIRQLTKR